MDFSFDAFVCTRLVFPPHHLQSVDSMAQIPHVFNAFQGKLHKKGICSMPILLCNICKCSLAYFISLVILILFPWNEKGLGSGVGD